MKLLDGLAAHAHWFLRIAILSVFLYHGLDKSRYDGADDGNARCNDFPACNNGNGGRYTGISGWLSEGLDDENRIPAPHPRDDRSYRHGALASVAFYCHRNSSYGRYAVSGHIALYIVVSSRKREQGEFVDHDGRK
jgi:hypothetical protein